MPTDSGWTPSVPEAVHVTRGNQESTAAGIYAVIVSSAVLSASHAHSAGVCLNCQRLGVRGDPQPAVGALPQQLQEVAQGERVVARIHQVGQVRHDDPIAVARERRRVARHRRACAGEPVRENHCTME